MQLAISLIPAGIRQFMRSGSSLSKLKICNAILLVLLSSLVLPAAKKAYAYTVLSASWNGTSATYSKNTNLGSFYSIAVDDAANDWSNSSSPFDFVANSASVNNIRFDALSPQLAITTVSYVASTRTIIGFIMRIDSSPADPWWAGGAMPQNWTDFRTVVRHELGHALGLGHTDISNRLMSPTLPSNTARSVDADAINGSRFMYDSSYTGSPPERSYYESSLPAYSGPGTYDDRSSNISYGGRAINWLNFSDVNAGFSTISRSATIGSRAHIALGPGTVNKITLFYSTGPDRRNATVYIDEVGVGTINAQTPEYRRQVGKTWAITPAVSRSFEVRFGPNAGLFDVDMFAVNIATVGGATYDDTHAQFRYFGTWTPTAGVAGAHLSTHTLSKTAGSLFRFAFDSNQVTYVFTRAYNRGKSAVTLDGIDFGSIDMYSATTQRQQTFTLGNLGAGTHVLNINVTGQKNPASVDTYVDVDALIVQ